MLPADILGELPMKKVWRFFSSIWLTVVLVILICLDGAWGSLLSMKVPGFYRSIDQSVLFKWLGEYGPHYLRFTLWMYILIALSALFAVNTLVCTVDRVYSIIKLKRPLRSFYPHIVHIGFLIALLGHLSGSLWGFRSPGNVLFKGEPKPVPNEPGLFARFDNIEMKSTPEGDLDSLKARVTLLKNNSEVLTKDIEINGPLIYRGVAFYYADQGQAPSGLSLDVNGEKITASFNAPFKTSDGASFRFGQIYPDFALDNNGLPYTRSEEFLNPRIELISGDGHSYYLDVSGRGKKTWAAGKTFRLDDYVLSRFVILNINRDPGITLIIAGSSMLVAGMVLLLFFRGERAELVRQP